LWHIQVEFRGREEVPQRSRGRGSPSGRTAIAEEKENNASSQS